MVKYGETEISKISFKDKLGNETDILRWVLSDVTVFTKKFRFYKTTTKAYVEVKRISNEFMLDLPLGEIREGLNLYYGDTLSIKARPEYPYSLNGIKVNGVNQNTTITLYVKEDIEIKASGYGQSCLACRMSLSGNITDPFMLSNTDFMAIEDPEDEEI